MNGWREEYQQKLVTLAEAALVIKSGDRIGMSPGASAPVDLMNAIAARHEELEDVTVYSGLLMQPFTHLMGESDGRIRHKSMFMGPIERKAMKPPNVGAYLYQFSKVGMVIRDRVKNNVALLECSLPDKNGYFSFGPMGTMANKDFIEAADTVIVQVNSKTPYLFGDQAHIPVSQVDYFCEKDRDIVDIPLSEAGEAEKKIAAFIVDKIPDGATLQLGIGKIADAVGSQLEEKNDLGIHTEMLTNSMVNLAKKGVVTCARKNFRPNRMTVSFGMGTLEMYEFMDRNQMLEMLPLTFVNDPRIIGKNDNLMSINSTLMVDLTGQVCSESVGFRQFSGTGGQLDFVRGARYSWGGKSFIALLSTAETGNGTVSKITSALPPGTAVTTPRTDTMYVVTEYGIVNLWGKSIEARVAALISIAHPDFRDQLTHEAKEAGLV